MLGYDPRTSINRYGSAVRIGCSLGQGGVLPLPLFKVASPEPLCSIGCGFVT